MIRAIILALTGSAPRARGTAGLAVVQDADERFSPACAGNGHARDRTDRKRSVQPRVRGERSGGWGIAIPDDGSAPRARGTAPRTHDPRLASRFSPACAGNGRCCRARPRRRTVQPRVRGGRDNAAWSKVNCSGSAPRARGTGVTHGLSLAAFRFSPACAGNGSLRPSGVWLASVQPRVRGEREVISADDDPSGGSAPRARGTAPYDARDILPQRFSPACAGNGRCRCRSR